MRSRCRLTTQNPRPRPSARTRRARTPRATHLAARSSSVRPSGAGSLGPLEQGDAARWVVAQLAVVTSPPLGVTAAAAHFGAELADGSRVKQPGAQHHVHRGGDLVADLL